MKWHLFSVSVSHINGVFILSNPRDTHDAGNHVYKTAEVEDENLNQIKNAHSKFQVFYFSWIKKVFNMLNDNF